MHAALIAAKRARTNVSKYDEYFNLMESQLAKYNMEAGNSYNMDEKDFMFGVVHKSKRVFSRHQCEQGEMTQIIQDKSRLDDGYGLHLCGWDSDFPRPHI